MFTRATRAVVLEMWQGEKLVDREDRFEGKRIKNVREEQGRGYHQNKTVNQGLIFALKK